METYLEEVLEEVETDEAGQPESKFNLDHTVPVDTMIRLNERWYANPSQSNWWKEVRNYDIEFEHVTPNAYLHSFFKMVREGVNSMDPGENPKWNFYFNEHEKKEKFD